MRREATESDSREEDEWRKALKSTEILKTGWYGSPLRHGGFRREKERSENSRTSISMWSNNIQPQIGEKKGE